MRGWLYLFAAAVFAVNPAAASPIAFSFSGTFLTDDMVQFLTFAVSTQATPVTLQTKSFAGGTNAIGQVVPSGGFAPVLSVFNSAQNLLTYDSGGVAPSGCGPRNIDSSTGMCLDAYLNLTLQPGNYTLALTEYGNIPNGPTLGDGFLLQGTGNFTGGPFLIYPLGMFQRDGNWEVDIVGASSATGPGSGVPEPHPAVLWMSGLAVMGLVGAWRRLPKTRRKIL